MFLQAERDSNHEQEVADDVAERVQPPATLRYEILRTRDLTVAAIENAVDLKERGAANETNTIAAQKKQKGHDQQREDRYRPGIRRDWKFQQRARDGLGNRPVQKSRDEPVLRFA